MIGVPTSVMSFQCSGMICPDLQSQWSNADILGVRACRMELLLPKSAQHLARLVLVIDVATAVMSCAFQALWRMQRLLPKGFDKRTISAQSGTFPAKPTLTLEHSSIGLCMCDNTKPRKKTLCIHVSTCQKACDHGDLFLDQNHHDSKLPFCPKMAPTVETCMILKKGRTPFGPV